MSIKDNFQIIVTDFNTLNELPEDHSSNDRSILNSIGNYASQKKLKSIDFNTFSNNLNEFTESFSKSLSKAQSTIAGYSLDEVEVSVSINSKGGIAVIASAEIGATAAIKLKFKKSNNQN